MIIIRYNGRSIYVPSLNTALASASPLTSVRSTCWLNILYSGFNDRIVYVESTDDNLQLTTDDQTLLQDDTVAGATLNPPRSRSGVPKPLQPVYTYRRHS